MILLLGEYLRRRRDTPPITAPAGAAVVDGPSQSSAAVAAVDASIDPRTRADHRFASLPVGLAVLIGVVQIAALAPGISRSGAAMVTGLVRGLPHGDAARFAFLLATPVILATGVLKLGDLAGPLGDGIRPQILVGSLLSGVGAYLSVRYLTRYFETRSLRPFGSTASSPEVHPWPGCSASLNRHGRAAPRILCCALTCATQPRTRRNYAGRMESSSGGPHAGNCVFRRDVYRARAAFPRLGRRILADDEPESAMWRRIGSALPK